VEVFGVLVVEQVWSCSGKSVDMSRCEVGVKVAETHCQPRRTQINMWNCLLEVRT
jgi:hypothetical protein